MPPVHEQVEMKQLLAETRLLANSQCHHALESLMLDHSNMVAWTQTECLEVQRLGSRHAQLVRADKMLLSAGRLGGLSSNIHRVHNDGRCDVINQACTVHQSKPTHADLLLQALSAQCGSDTNLLQHNIVPQPKFDTGLAHFQTSGSTG